MQPDMNGLSQPTATRALRNILSHGESSGQSSGAQLRLALRGVRSGCGIRIVARPSSLDRPAMASAAPLGLAGYAVAGLPSPCTQRSAVSAAVLSAALAHSARTTPWAIATGIREPAIPPLNSDGERKRDVLGTWW